MIELTELFYEKGVNFVSLKEAIDTKTSTGELLFAFMSTITQFERDCIADRIREGLKSGRGKAGGRPKMKSIRKMKKTDRKMENCIRRICNHRKEYSCAEDIKQFAAVLLIGNL